MTRARGRPRALASAACLHGRSAWRSRVAALRADHRRAGRAAAGEPGTVEATKLRKVPKQTKFVEAEYPAEAAEKGIEAEVVPPARHRRAAARSPAVGVAEPANPPGHGLRRGGDRGRAAVRVRARRDGRQADRRPDHLQLQVHAQAARRPPPPPPPAGAAAPPRRRRRASRWSTSPASCASAAPACPWPASWSPCSATTSRQAASASRPPPTPRASFRFFDLAPGEWKVLVEAPGYLPLPHHRDDRRRTRRSTSPTTSSAAPTTPTTSPSPPPARARRSAAPSSPPRWPTRSRAPPAIRWRSSRTSPAWRAPPFDGLLIVRGSAPEDTRDLRRRRRGAAHLPLRRPQERAPGRHARQHRVLPGQLLADVRPRHRRHHRRPDQEAAAAEARRLRRRQHPRHRRLPRGAARRQGAPSRSAGRRSYIDVILNAAVPDDAGVNLVTAPRYYDYQLLANYRPAAGPRPARVLLRLRRPAASCCSRTPPTSTRRSRATRLLATSPRSTARCCTYRYVPSDRFENKLRLVPGPRLVCSSAPAS